VVIAGYAILPVEEFDVFLQPAFSTNIHIADTALIINTALLIMLIVVIEFIYSDSGRVVHQRLRVLYPLMVVIVALFLFATYQKGVV
jgi:hypothetical protein